MCVLRVSIRNWPPFSILATNIMFENAQVVLKEYDALVEDPLVANKEGPNRVRGGTSRTRGERKRGKQPRTEGIREGNIEGPRQGRDPERRERRAEKNKREGREGST